MNEQQLVTTIILVAVTAIISFCIWAGRSLMKTDNELDEFLKNAWNEAKEANTPTAIHKIYVDAEKYYKKNAYKEGQYTRFHELFGYLTGKYEKWD